MSEPIDIRLNATAGQLLVHLAQEMGEDNPSAVVVRALGLLEMAHRAKKQGEALFFRGDDGRESEVVF